MRKVFFGVIVTAYACLITLPAHAQEAIDMDRIVVTSSRTPQDIRQATQAITIIDAQDIASSNAQTITDILKTVPGLSVRDYNGTGKQVNVDMRGYGETGPSNMLVLIDGRRVNAIDLSNTDWSQISLSQVEKIEIARGASSVLYGDNATAGVVNIITKKGDGRPSVTLEQKGGSYNTNGTSIFSGGSSDTSSYRISGEYFDTEGYRKNSSLLRRDFGAQLSHEWSPHLNTNLTFGYHRDDYGLPGALREDEMVAWGRRGTKYPDDRATASDWFAHLEFKNDLEEKGRLETNFSVRTRAVDSTYVSSGWLNENYMITIGATPKYTLNNFIGDRENTFILGLDFYFTQDNILDGSVLGSQDKMEISKNSQGIYLQDQLQITPKISLKSGYRHEAAQYNFRQLAQSRLKEESRLADEVYNIGATYLYGESSQLFLSYGTSFRYPLVDEFYSSFNPMWGVGGLNSSLSTQTGRDLEAGVRHDLGKKASIGLTYFRHDIDNEIYLNADPASYANENYPETLHQGVELETQIHFHQKITGFANYTYTSAVFGRGPYDGNIIPGVPQHEACAGINFKPTTSLRLNIAINYVGSMYLISDQSNSYPKCDEYATVDIHLNYLWKGADLFWGMNNIFDAEYSSYGILSTFSGTRNFYPAPGRQVIAGIRYKF